MKKIRIEIEGMTCSNCEGHVKEELGKIKGVKNINVSAKNKEATLKVEEEVSEEDLKNAVETAGYEPIKIMEKKRFFG